MSNELYEIIRANKLYRFQQQREHDTNDKDKQELDKIVDFLSKQKNKETIKKEKFDDHVAILREARYKKKWHILKMDDKINRIEEYCKSNDIEEDKMNILIQNQKNKGFCSKDIIDDHIGGKIVRIVNIDTVTS